MFKYFQTELANVKRDGVLINNAMVVYTLSTVQTKGDIEIPSKYFGCNLIGKMYDPETQEFYQVEPVPEEPSQLDRMELDIAEIKTGSTQLLGDIKAEAIDAYTLELIENGVL